MGRKAWVAAGFVVVAGAASWLALPGVPREADSDVDGAFQASVKEPARAHTAGREPVLLASAERVSAKQELDQRFETDPHDAEAPRVESTVQAAFARDDVAAELLKSVSCRKTLCKLSVRMSKERIGGYNRAMNTLRQAGFSEAPDASVLFDQKSDPGELDVDMYLQQPAAVSSDVN